MTDETIYESETTRSRRAIATYLRRLAARLGRGEPVPVDEAQTVTVDPPAATTTEVELERDDETVSLEVELTFDGSVVTDTDASRAMFGLYEDAAAEHRWRLRHRNGNVIADSGEGYTDKRDAENGIESVRRNAPGATLRDESTGETIGAGGDATFELYEDAAGDWRWRLRHHNTEIIADGGQGYASKQRCKQGIRSVRQNARGAPVEELS